MFYVLAITLVLNQSEFCVYVVKQREQLVPFVAGHVKNGQYIWN